jgi:hypothetical protein
LKNMKKARKREMKRMILRRKKMDIVILTVDQAVSEAKWIDKNSNNTLAIENRYGSTERCWEARSKIYTFISKHNYCIRCYEIPPEDEQIDVDYCGKCWEELEEAYFESFLPQ